MGPVGAHMARGTTGRFPRAEPKHALLHQPLLVARQPLGCHGGGTRHLSK